MRTVNLLHDDGLRFVGDGVDAQTPTVKGVVRESDDGRRAAEVVGEPESLFVHEAMDEVESGSAKGRFNQFALFGPKLRDGLDIFPTLFRHMV